jgi:hypothetical protein
VIYESHLVLLEQRTGLESCPLANFNVYSVEPSALPLECELVDQCRKNWSRDFKMVFVVAVAGAQDASFTERALHVCRDSPHAASTMRRCELGVVISDRAEQTADNTGLQERSSLHCQRFWKARRSSHVPTWQR